MIICRQKEAFSFQIELNSQYFKTKLKRFDRSYFEIGLEEFKVAQTFRKDLKRFYLENVGAHFELVELVDFLFDQLVKHLDHLVQIVFVQDQVVEVKVEKDEELERVFYARFDLGSQQRPVRYELFNKHVVVENVWAEMVKPVVGQLYQSLEFGQKSVQNGPVVARYYLSVPSF